MFLHFVAGGGNGTSCASLPLSPMFGVSFCYIFCTCTSVDTPGFWNERVGNKEFCAVYVTHLGFFLCAGILVGAEGIKEALSLREEDGLILYCTHILHKSGKDTRISII